MGPSTVFDKSALQALSVDEAVWLEAHFLANVTPLFYVETLADLEKAAAEGRTPEEAVGSLAAKTAADAYPKATHVPLPVSPHAGFGRAGRRGMGLVTILP